VKHYKPLKITDYLSRLKVLRSDYLKRFLVKKVLI